MSIGINTRCNVRPKIYIVKGLCMFFVLICFAIQYHKHG